jgi:hypothetical protein
VSTAQPPLADRTTIEFPATEGFRSVGRFVLGGIASRFELPVDRVDDLLLAVESLFMQELLGDTIRLEAEPTPSGFVVRMGPFPPDRLSDPGLRRVLERLVDDVGERAGADGASVELVVSAASRADPA